MAQIKCGMLLLASVLLFWVLSKWRFLPSKPSAVITPPFASSSHPSICPCSKTWESMTITDFSLCSSERHCCRNVTPSFHAPLARMCAHRRGRVDYMWPLEHSVDEINRARWAMYWHHKHCTLSCSHAIKVEVGGAQVNFSESWRKFDEQTWQLASSFWLEVTKVHLINCSMSHCKMHHSSLKEMHVL